jgi:hypothetical protein
MPKGTTSNGANDMGIGSSKINHGFAATGFLSFPGLEGRVVDAGPAKKIDTNTNLLLDNDRKNMLAFLSDV